MYIYIAEARPRLPCYGVSERASGNIIAPRRRKLHATYAGRGGVELRFLFEILVISILI